VLFAFCGGIQGTRLVIADDSELPLMTMSSSVPSRLKSILVDLGKPTMRGIRRCPKCWTVNGTRSSNCKNKQCDAVFKQHGAEKRKRSSECVKVCF